MTDHTDAPRLPDRDAANIGGSLADHVRRYAATDPETATVRDHLAELADRIPAVPPTSSPSPVAQTPAAEPVGDGEISWDVIPPGVDRVLTSEGAEAVYNGGLWTLTFPDQTRRQLGHGHFVSTQGPFRPLPD